MPSSIQIVLLAPVGLVLYAGSILFWPIYRLLHRKRTRRGRALFQVFVVQLVLYLGWSALLLISALRHGDWLHGVTVYLLMNVIFLFVGVAVWSSTDNGEISSDGKTRS